ncbi:sensor histidine kinase [Foetidibacter luteolus]|uniref:sensor histidine kinase n=1 Tax=Foetidibacter luteolus TaxID=2608880 RepID=UPI001A98BE66|nr:histidine kinase [Foetidibacter luteolus]
MLSALWAFLGTAFFLWVLTVTGIQQSTNPQNPLTDQFFHFTIYAYYQVSIITVSWTAIYFLVHYIREIRKAEQKKAQLKIKLIESEAQALRSQMNPHFIFNCMNSIKSLIQTGEDDKAIDYLTTFSKLIRTIFNNSDKKEISLFDEIETCRLYTQLESMRFENKFSCTFDINKNIDLKSLSVPALIIQPFIENAIWHGIVPKEDGGYVNISVQNENEAVRCMINDNGIGREMSKQNKFKTDSTHHSKGMHLTQSRLDLDNLINERNASLEIIDQKDEHGNATGTSVILTFKKY